MNEKQRAARGTIAIALIVAALFYVPWRIEASGDLRWAPFYRNPIVGRSTLQGETIESRFVRLKGRPVWSLYLLQLAGIAGAGLVVYRVLADPEE